MLGKVFTGSRTVRDRSIGHIMQGAVAGLVLLCWAAPAGAGEEAPEAWDPATFAGLFPAALEGWTAGAVEVEELKTLTSDFEAMSAAMSGLFIAPSARLRLSRRYAADAKQIDMEIDSQDITAASTIQASHEDDEVRRLMIEGGFEPRMFGEHRGLVIASEGKVAFMIQVGDSGAIGLECAYENCGVDLESHVQRLNFDELTRFAEFDHRMSKQPEESQEDEADDAAE